MQKSAMQDIVRTTPSFLSNTVEEVTTAAAAAAGSSSSSSSGALSEPSVNQKLFLVVSVALATVCFFTNVLQVAVFVRPSSVRSVKGVLLLSQALSGLVATFIVAFPIHVISARGGSEGGYTACYLGHSGVILVTLLTSLGTSTLLLFFHYLKNNDPRRFMTAGTNVVGWGAGVVAVWVVAVGVSILPYAGWNSWLKHDARCHLSTLWPLSFTAFLSFMVGGHVAVALLMWASTHASDMKASAAAKAARRGRTVPTAALNSEEAPIASHTSGVYSGVGGVHVGGWCVSLGSVVPLLLHVVVASSCAASSACLAQPGHYHEEATALPWGSLLLVAVAIINPLLYVFSDDQVSSSTLLLLSRVCCWWCEGRKQRLVPRQPEPHDAETNVYVTNDTDQLVSDNT